MSENGNVYIIQPNKNNFKAPNLVSILENENILKIGHFLRFDKNALEYFLKCKIKNILIQKLPQKLFELIRMHMVSKILFKNFVIKLSIKDKEVAIGIKILKNYLINN